MTDAPENIWAMQFDEPVDANSQGTWGTVSGLERKQRTGYTRTDIANARIAELESALTECQEEIDDYIRQEYPGKNYLHERYRQRDFAANPARIALGTPNPTTGAK
jgi:hypothetical protein